MRRSVVLWTILAAALFVAVAAATCSGDAPDRESRSDSQPESEGAAATATQTRIASGTARSTRRPPRERAALPERPAAPELVIEERLYGDPTESWVNEERLEIGGAPQEVLVWRYMDMADSGVELERSSGGKVLWRVHVAPLGIAHSKYHHEAKVRIDADRIVVESVGAQRIVEIRELATGTQVSREITDIPR